ncbi:MAG: hypothetical protein M4D80_07615 [Myxococcota bacterium]|nr:hypothetical protein [Myxococcota bacterium]
MRALLIAVVLVVGSGDIAEARRGGGAVLINTGDDILHIRDLSVDDRDAYTIADPSSEVPGEGIFFGKLGYRYERFGVFFMDIWRWDGEFVLYSGDTYVTIDDEMLALVGGASVPWRYRLPDGLLILIAAAYLGFIGRRKRSAKSALIIAGVLAVISLVFFLLGLTWEFGIPLVIAAHHAIAARSAMKHAPEEEAVVEEAPAPVRVSRPSQPPPVRPSRPMPKGTPPPVSQSGEYASRPSQPIVVDRPSTAPVVVPMRADESVDGPKLLR